ncbi:FAD-binding oxidoreductase [Nonomuraea sp. NBC_00507]|uniref:FAD-binding oxidoreductase n=1 Tax=Nonomuraea sp. NBC_00507 TaxID=2976002 RepID=UPI002E16BBAE
MSTTPTHTTLRRALPGRFLLPGDAGWDAARQAWNLAADQQPVAVAVPTTPKEVAAVVTAARERGLRITAQTTGHAAAALADLHDTVLLKTADLNGVHIDPQARQARIGAGTLWIEVAEPAAEHGLAALAGSSPDVGVAGYTLGGGLSWLARKHGLACNRLLAAEAVTADGDLIRADPGHEPDLFWALRGGGGSFAVVTALEFELLPIPRIYAGGLFWPWERAGEVLHAWNTWQATAPEEITSSARILHLPEPAAPLPGRSVVNIDAAVLGDQRFGEQVLAPLRGLAPGLDTFAMVAPAALSRLHLDPEQPVPVISDHRLFGELPPAGIDALVQTAGPGSGSRLVTVELRQLGAALARPTPGSGALTSIDATFALIAGGIADRPETGAAVAEDLERLTGAMRPWDTGRRYLNFAEGPAEASTLFPPETYLRLRRVKAQVDPGDVIRSHHPIPPTP